MASGMGDKVRGKAEELGSRAQETLGDATDNARTQAKGGMAGDTRGTAIGEEDRLVETGERGGSQMGTGSGRMTVKAEELEDSGAERGR
jgi:uncharacterized protein YjbJ (UPF0337 family)